MTRFIRILAALAFLGALTVRAQDAEVKITGNDAMQYDIKAFEVKPGQKVKLTFTNIGKLPKVAMGHNVTVLKKGSDKQAFAMEAIKFAANDYIPTSAPFKDQIIAHTKLLGPGESESIEFTAPAEAGEYPFLCTFPGHFAVMNGIMTVK